MKATMVALMSRGEVHRMSSEKSIRFWGNEECSCLGLGWVFGPILEWFSCRNISDYVLRGDVRSKGLEGNCV